MSSDNKILPKMMHISRQCLLWLAAPRARGVRCRNTRRSALLGNANVDFYSKFNISKF